MRNFYAARPINTYGEIPGTQYLSFLQTRFGGKIIDPNSVEVTQAVDAIKAKYPAQKDYDQFGANEVMDYFAGLVLGVGGGAGLALPMKENGEVVFRLPAGIAKELATIHGNGYPTWIVTCTKQQGEAVHVPYKFTLDVVTGVAKEEVSSEKGAKEQLLTFATKHTPFPQLTIQQTRERIYFWPDRASIRPYFLEDAA